MAKEEIQYVWSDKKRTLFGLPLSFTRYQLSEDRLFLSQGFLNIKDDEVLLYRVRDIDTRRNLWQRLFGVGTVTVLSSDKTMPTLVLKNVKDGDIVLLHDMTVSSVQAALDIVDVLKDQGYEIVTVSELVKLRGVNLKPGKIYTSFPVVLK